MDQTRRRQLIAKCKDQGLAKRGQAPPIVPLEDFFEGNDDISSIGCNIMLPPGPATFFQTLLEIRSLPNVQDVLVEIMEIEEGDENMWPFSERIYIIANSSVSEVEKWVDELEPSEVDEGFAFEVPRGAPVIEANNKVFSAWWD